MFSESTRFVSALHAPVCMWMNQWISVWATKPSHVCLCDLHYWSPQSLSLQVMPFHQYTLTHKTQHASWYFVMVLNHMFSHKRWETSKAIGLSISSFRQILLFWCLTLQRQIKVNVWFKILLIVRRSVIQPAFVLLHSRSVRTVWTNRISIFDSFLLPFTSILACAHSITQRNCGNQ